MGDRHGAIQNFAESTLLLTVKNSRAILFGNLLSSIMEKMELIVHNNFEKSDLKLELASEKLYGHTSLKSDF